jgi:hypothetical protein
MQQLPPVLGGEFPKGHAENSSSGRIGEVEHTGEFRVNSDEQPGCFGLNTVITVVGLALFQSRGVGGAAVKCGTPWYALGVAGTSWFMRLRRMPQSHR